MGLMRSLWSDSGIVNGNMGIHIGLVVLLFVVLDDDDDDDDVDCLGMVAAVLQEF